MWNVQLGVWWSMVNFVVVKTEFNFQQPIDSNFSSPLFRVGWRKATRSFGAGERRNTETVLALIFAKIVDLNSEFVCYNYKRKSPNIFSFNSRIFLFCFLVDHRSICFKQSMLDQHKIFFFGNKLDCINQEIKCVKKRVNLSIEKSSSWKLQLDDNANEIEKKIIFESCVNIFRLQRQWKFFLCLVMS